MKVAGVVVAVPVVVLLAGAQACGSFGADPAVDADGGAAPDGGGLPPSTDGAVRARCTTGALAAFTEPFDIPDGGVWSGVGWDPAAVGALGVSTSESSSPPSSLNLDIAAPNPANRWLARPLGLPCHLTAKAQIKITSFGAGDLDLFGVEDDAVPPRGVLLSRAGGETKIEYPVDQVPSAVSLGTQPTFQAWTEVLLDLDLKKATWSALVGGESVGGALPAGWPETGRLKLRVGLLFNQDVTKNWSIRFDDVGVAE